MEIETDCSRMNSVVTSEYVFAARDWEIEMFSDSLFYAQQNCELHWSDMKSGSTQFEWLVQSFIIYIFVKRNKFFIEVEERNKFASPSFTKHTRTWLSRPLCHCYLPHNTAHYGMYSWMRLYCNCCSIGCTHFYSIYRWNTFAGSIVAWPAMPFYRNSVERQRKSCRHYFVSSDSFDRIYRRRFHFRLRFHWFGCHCSDCIGVEMAVVAHICVE